MKKRYIAIFLVGLLFGISIQYMESQGQLGIDAIDRDFKQANERLTEMKNGNQDAFSEIIRRGNAYELPYAMIMAEYAGLKGDFEKRDKAIWYLLSQANSVESILILGKFKSLYDPVPGNSDAFNNDGSVNALKMNALENVTFSQNQINTMKACYRRLNPDKISANGARAISKNRASLHWREKLFNTRGVCMKY